MAQKKGAAQNGQAQESGKISLPGYKGYKINLDPLTGNFEATVGTETIVRSTLPLVQGQIDRLTGGHRAIVVGRTVREVVLLGKDKNGHLKVAGGGKIANPDSVYEFDGDLMKRLAAASSRREKAEQEYEKVMSETDAEIKEVMEGASHFNTAIFDTSDGDGDGDGDGEDADPVDEEEDAESDAAPAVA